MDKLKLSEAIDHLRFIAKHNRLKLHQAKDYRIAVTMLKAQQN